MPAERVCQYFEEDMGATTISDLQKVTPLEVYHYCGIFQLRPEERKTFRKHRQLHISILLYDLYGHVHRIGEHKNAELRL